MVICLLLIGLASAPAPDRPPQDFSRLGKATGESVVIVDRDGLVFEGILASATADDITMRFASGERVFPRAAIASADRLRDGTSDGFIKGAIVGALLGWIAYEAYGSDGIRADLLLRTSATYGAIGWTIDALNQNRQSIYRAPPSAAPGVKLSFRF